MTARVWVGSGAVPAVRAVAVRERGGSAGATVLNASGYVTARRRATVSARVTARLTEVNVEEGMPVRAGQVLARLEDLQYRAALALDRARLDAARRTVEETRARLELARLTRDRTRRLAADGVLGEAELDRARLDAEALEARLAVDTQQVDVARRAVELRQAELDDTVIKAPFDGIVISKDAQAGEMVSPMSAGGGFTRTGICTIVDMSSLEIEVDVNEAYIRRVDPGQGVEAVLDAYPDWRIPARVITTIPAADRQTATVLVRIGFDQLDPRILPDMGVKVAFRGTADPAAAGGSRLYVPREAVRREDGRDVVFVVRGDHVERRAIRLGDADAEELQVLAGLASGERVVIEGPPGLRDGQRVAAGDDGGR